jgi:hypothetical protein
MPRKNRRPADQAPVRNAPSAERRDEWRGEQYMVRSLVGADKEYRCPGCDQLIRRGTPHVVTWPARDTEATDRRHWHTSCWAARDRRAPTDS